MESRTTIFVQRSLIELDAGSFPRRHVPPFRTQLLKWIGNKQRFAHEIIRYFPRSFETYYEPFLGSGGVLGTLVPDKAVASDSLNPLMEIWTELAKTPLELKQWYAERCNAFMSGDRVEVYERIKHSFNRSPNGADLVFLSRACYGGVVRFRKHDGYMSTPCGPHTPISPESFSSRVDTWHERTQAVRFRCTDFEVVMEEAKAGDFVYCDPPYQDTQSILYGSQNFSFDRLLTVIERCKSRGVYVALSIDGTKRSGDFICNLPIPTGLFEQQAFVNCGRSMLRRFQMGGETLEAEMVADRLLLTY